MANRPSAADSVAASWKPLAVALLDNEDADFGDAVRQSTLDALIALTPALGIHYRELKQSQLQRNVIVLAGKLFAHPKLFASSQLPAQAEGAKLVLMCISLYGAALDDRRVETCSTEAIRLAGRSRQP